MNQKAFLIDTSRCVGCKTCQNACKSAHSLSAGDSVAASDYSFPETLSASTWTHVVFSGVQGKNPVVQMCNHCVKAECRKSCPVRAIDVYDGWTIIDRDRCIGCGTCVSVCPYRAVGLLESQGAFTGLKKAYKCDACTSLGLSTPVCVESCPMDAILFGNRLRLIKRAKKRVELLRKKFPDASLYGLDPFGGLHVLTILTERHDERGTPIAMDFGAARIIYSFLQKFSFGFDQMKRIAWDISRALAGKGNG